MRKLAVSLALLFTAAAILAGPLVAAAAGGTTMQVTQVDPSRFPTIALYVSALDAGGQPLVGLTKEDFTLLEDGKRVDIIDFAGPSQARPVDIVFVFDTTGSMAGEINGVKNTCVDFANRLSDSHRDFRLGLVTFGDEIRSVSGAGGALTADANEFKSWIDKLTADGGGDDPEISLDALKRATTLQYRADTQKVLILITDAPPHVAGDGTTYSSVSADEVTTLLRDGGYTVYGVAYDDRRFRDVIDQTHGEFYDIRRRADFTGIIDRLGKAIATQYRMTYHSNRPAYDGTRRAIEVEAAGATATGRYTEEHLINVRSDPLLALALFVPLLALLAGPGLVPRLAAGVRNGRARIAASRATRPARSGGRAAMAPTVPAQGSVSAGPAPAQAVCGNCGRPLRPGARFCGVCGQVVGQAAPIAAQPQPPAVQAATCPQCGQPLRPGARFCGVCGRRTG